MDEEFARIRREFHAHPEVSQKEFKTQERIEHYLNQFGVEHHERVAGTGVLVSFDFGNGGGHVLIRGDIDGLPIEEELDKEHVSKNVGVSHKCGHDGHLTIILALAKKLTEQPLSSGKVTLLFQPAEEIGVGAGKVLNDPAFADVNPDLVFALHNLPGFAQSKIIVRDGAFSAAATSLIFKLKGMTSHAAEPEHGINPASTISALLDQSKKLSHNNVDTMDFALVTPVYAILGEKAYGVSAGYGEVHFTLRAWTDEKIESLKERVIEVAEKCCAENNIKLKTKCIESFWANVSDPKAVEIIREAADKNNLEWENTSHPFKWGEDFGLFTKKFKGAMFGIGAGVDSPALHNPDYDFPDEIINDAASIFYSIAEIATQK